jgi:DNA-binding transcriptional MerR regulator
MSMQYLPVTTRPGRRLSRGPMNQDDFARRSGLHPELVRRFVALGLVPAVRDANGALWFTPEQVAAVARLQRLRTTLPLNYAALGLVVDLLDRITELETLLRIRGRTEPVRPRVRTHKPTRSNLKRSPRWTSTA